MNEQRPVKFTEDRIPSDGIEQTIEELVELYGGEIKESRARERRFVLPLRRGVAVSGGVECTVSWAEEATKNEATVTLVCDREVDAPKFQRVLLLIAGVIGSVLFMLWPFFGKAATEMGTLAWVGGLMALAVYFLTLRRASGGVAYDFLQRLASRQRATADQ
jgi:hypothetical protein